MKALITGGTGFIGARLALRLRQDGIEPVVTGQCNTEWEKSRVDGLKEAGIDVHEVALDDKERLLELLENCTTVFHLAAAQHEVNVPDSHFYNVNVEGTRSLLDCCHSSGVQHVVHGSTIGVYGEAMDGELDEESPLRPDNIYGVTKLEGERLALSYNDRLPVTAVRISETYGPGDGRLIKLFKGLSKGNFPILGRGENRRQLIHVDDLVDGMCRAAASVETAGEVYILAGTEILTTHETVAEIASALGVGYPKIRLPLWPFVTLAWTMEKTLAPLGIRPPLTRRRLNFFRKTFYFSTAKARDAFGFAPAIPFSKGAAQTAAWYKENGVL